MDALTLDCERQRQALLALAHNANGDGQPTSTQAVCAGFVTAPRHALGKFDVSATVVLPDDEELAGKMLAMMLLAFRSRYRFAFDQALHRLKSQNLLPTDL